MRKEGRKKIYKKKWEGEEDQQLNGLFQDNTCRYIPDVGDVRIIVVVFLDLFFRFLNVNE